MGSDNTWNMGFTASMPLIAPSLWKSISISDEQIVASLESARASKLDLVNNINKAYYSLLLAIDSKDVVKQNYDIAVLNADVYAKRLATGTASEYDVLRSSVQVKNIEPELLQADIAVRQCQLQLKVLMGYLRMWRYAPTSRSPTCSATCIPIRHLPTGQYPTTPLCVRSTYRREYSQRTSI